MDCGVCRKKTFKSHEARIVEEHFPDVRQRSRDIGMSGNLPQRSDHGVGIIGDSDGSRIRHKLAATRQGEIEQKGTEMAYGSDEEGEAFAGHKTNAVCEFDHEDSAG